MDVQEAVDAAKKHIAHLFRDEGAGDVQLEEVVYDDAAKRWLVTVSFLRAARRPPDDATLVPSLGHLATRGFLRFRTDFKVVKLNDEGKVLSVTSGPLPTAA